MKAQFVYENVRFERGKDPKGTMGLGLLGTVREAAAKIGLSQESSIPLLGSAGGNSIGTHYQWTNPNWRMTKMELDAYNNYYNFPALRVFNMANHDEEITGTEEIIEFISSGELERFINLNR